MKAKYVVWALIGFIALGTATPKSQAQYEQLADLDFGAAFQGIDLSGFAAWDEISTWHGQSQDQINDLYAVGWIDEEVRDQMHDSMLLLATNYIAGASAGGQDPEQLDFGYPDNWGPSDYDDTYWVDPPPAADEYGPMITPDGLITSEGRRLAEDLWAWQQNADAGAIQEPPIFTPKIPIHPDQMDLFGSGLDGGWNISPIMELVAALRASLSSCDEHE